MAHCRCLHYIQLETAIELSLADEHARRAERAQLEAHGQQRFERAVRQLSAVAPEHRLVAHEWERNWEEALRHEPHEPEGQALCRRERPSELTAQELEAILR